MTKRGVFFHHKYTFLLKRWVFYCVNFCFCVFLGVEEFKAPLFLS